MFRSTLKVEKIGSKRWRLLEDLIYEDESFKITVPAGFETDFATVPRPLWWFCPPATGSHAEPSVTHDYLLATGVDIKIADNLFLSAMEANGVNKLKRLIIFTTLKIWHRIVK